MPQVKLRFGDLFDGPSDLVVLPCSTVGTITRSVALRLARHSIPRPAVGLRLGDVQVMPFEGGEDIAQFVAFAASVHVGTTSAAAVASIGRALGLFTIRHEAVKYVAAPLLGAGAGGLAPGVVVEALREGFLATASADATLVVHVLDADVYDRLKPSRPAPEPPPRSKVRVFISHTSKTPEATAWVEALARHLSDSGLQPRLDRFHLRHGMDVVQWMCLELKLADKVVVVCDELYKEKADGRLGGVGWETMIIQGDLAEQPADSTKYQVVVRSAEMAQGLPMYLKTRYAFHAPGAGTDAAFRRDLVGELLDLPIDPLLAARECVL